MNFLRSLQLLVISIQLYSALGKNSSECGTDCQQSTCGTNSVYEQYMSAGRKIMENSLSSDGFDVITKTILLNETDPDATRASILKYFHDTYDTFSSLYETVKEENFWMVGDTLRHPVGWYVGHTTGFYVNKLRISGVIAKPVNEQFEAMFAVGVDEMSWDDKLEPRDDWPPVKSVKKYRSDVRKIVSDIIQDLPMELPIGWMSKWYAILMGIEHERIHLETSSVLIRQLPLSAVHQTPQKDSGTSIWYNKCDGGIFDKSIDFKPDLGAPDHSPLNELIPLKESSDVEYGRPTEQRNLGSENLSDYMVPVYGWDNEFGEAIITDIPKFSVSKYLVSNEEYYEFVLENGYNRKEFWTDEGWRWKTSVNAEYPKFWVKENNEWKYRNMLDTMDLPWDWPVITNQLEAHAFTQWKTAKTGKNIRLPTEDEWFAMRKGFAFGFDRDNNDNNYEDFSIFIEEQPMWDVAPGNTNFEFFASENPVDMFEFGDTGLYDVVGNVWQHTLTPQHPFKGFHVHPWYDDFTVPCFGSMHNMLKGGSWISTGNEAMSYSRYQFRRHFFQFAGIRYVESDRDLSFLDVLADSTPYNSDMVVDMYTHFHYWDEKYFGVQNYALTVGRIAIKYMNESMHGKALDLGCATGRSSFELATVFDDVTGIDFTARLISIGYRLKIDKELDWKVPIQGEIMESHRVTLEELGYSEEIADKVEFYQNDAQNLDEQYTGYDLVVASNLIDRLSNPMLFLTSIHERINKYGKLVLLSPYTWLEEYAPKERWIGAKYKTVKKEDGSTEEIAVYTLDMLKEILSQWFIFEGDEHVEMVIRETANKFQHTRPHATIWTRK